MPCPEKLNVRYASVVSSTELNRSEDSNAVDDKTDAYRTSPRQLSFLRRRLLFQTLRGAVGRQTRSEIHRPPFWNPGSTTSTTDEFVFA